jgi:hypothetical protein
MAIANGSTIDGSELYLAIAAPYANNLATDNARIAGAWQLGFDFVALASGTAAALRAQSFTVPDDDIELLDVGAYVEPGGPTAVYVVTLEGGPLVAPIAVAGAMDSAGGELARLSASSPPRHVLLRGATYRVTVTSSSASVGTVRVFAVLRSLPRRR